MKNKEEVNEKTYKESRKELDIFSFKLTLKKLSWYNHENLRILYYNHFSLVIPNQDLLETDFRAWHVSLNKFLNNKSLCFNGRKNILLRLRYSLKDILNGALSFFLPSFYPVSPWPPILACWLVVNCHGQLS